MIQIQAIGNLGKDAEQKTIGGNSYASFSIGVTEKNKGEDKTTWIRIMKLDKEGKLTAYLTKGTKVWVNGRPFLSVYTNKNGDAIPDMTIWAEKLEFCSSKEKEHNSQTQTPVQQAYPDDDSDLPF